LSSLLNEIDDIENDAKSWRAFEPSKICAFILSPQKDFGFYQPYLEFHFPAHSRKPKRKRNDHTVLFLVLVPAFQFK